MMDFGDIFAALNEHPTFIVPVIVIASRENWWLFSQPEGSASDDSL